MSVSIGARYIDDRGELDLSLSNGRKPASRKTGPITRKYVLENGFAFYVDDVTPTLLDLKIWLAGGVSLSSTAYLPVRAEPEMQPSSGFAAATRPSSHFNLVCVSDTSFTVAVDALDSTAARGFNLASQMPRVERHQLSWTVPGDNGSTTRQWPVDADLTVVDRFQVVDVEHAVVDMFYYWFRFVKESLTEISVHTSIEELSDRMKEVWSVRTSPRYVYDSGLSEKTIEFHHKDNLSCYQKFVKHFDTKSWDRTYRLKGPALQLSTRGARNIGDENVQDGPPSDFIQFPNIAVHAFGVTSPIMRVGSGWNVVSYYNRVWTTQNSAWDLPRMGADQHPVYPFRAEAHVPVDYEDLDRPEVPNARRRRLMG